MEIGGCVLTALDGVVINADTFIHNQPIITADGSAYVHLMWELSRGAWAAIYLDEAHIITIIFSGPIWVISVQIN